MPFVIAVFDVRMRRLSACSVAFSLLCTLLLQERLAFFQRQHAVLVGVCLGRTLKQAFEPLIRV
jgi:hypothetical protein